MSIMINSQTLYLSAYAGNAVGSKKSISRGSPGRSRGSTLFKRAGNSSDTGGSKAVQEEKNPHRQQIREMLKSMDKKLYKEDSSGRKTYTGVSQDKANGFLDLRRTTSSGSNKTKVKKPVNYNYKEVSAKIRQAKTSISAGKAVIAAKRKVVEIRRKIEAGDGDPEELQFALTHAKRIEMVARKKKHNLELEELVEHTRSRDENQEKIEEAANNIQESLAESNEEKISEEEDKIFEEREDMIHDAVEEMEERGTDNMDEMLDHLNEMISKFGEEELKELEEAMEAFELMEIVDPHMSEEDLEDLKRKHRAAESRALVKADMDYLKSMIKHQMEKANSPQVSAVSSGGSSFSMPAVNYTASTDVRMPELSDTGGMSIDISI